MVLFLCLFHGIPLLCLSLFTSSELQELIAENRSLNRKFFADRIIGAVLEPVTIGCSISSSTLVVLIDDGTKDALGDFLLSSFTSEKILIDLVGQFIVECKGS